MSHLPLFDALTGRSLQRKSPSSLAWGGATALTLAVCGLVWPLAGMAQPEVKATDTKAAEMKASEPKPAPLQVRIGHAAPLTGAIAFLGKDEENGVRLAIEQLNARKLHIGGRPVQWELVAADDGGVPAKAVAVAQQFCAAKLNAVIGHLQSGTTLPAARIYNDCGIPNITPAAGSAAITSAGYEETFRVIADERVQMDALIADAARRLGVKRLVLVDDGSAVGEALLDWVKAAAAAHDDVEIVDTVVLPKTPTPDFSPVLAAARKKRADAVFFPGMDVQGAALVRDWALLVRSSPQLARMHLLGAEALCTERLPEMVGKAVTLQRISCVQAGVPLENMHEVASFQQRYAKQFPKDTPVFSPYAYDATMVLAQAMLEADSSQAQAFVPYLRRTEYQGLTGKIAFTPQGDLHAAPVSVYRYVSGQRQRVTAPSAAPEKQAKPAARTRK